VDTGQLRGYASTGAVREVSPWLIHNPDSSERVVDPTLLSGVPVSPPARRHSESSRP
jgi:hypothetical protein